MDADILKSVGLVAGIGGIALAVLMTVFREVIQKSIFPQLDPAAGYRLLRLVLLLTWTVALAGVGAWAYGKYVDNPAPPGLKPFTLVGLVTDADDNAVAEASVSIVGNGAVVRSDSTGSFTLTSAIGDEREVILRVTKQGYRPQTQTVQLPLNHIVVKLQPAPGDAPVPVPVVAEDDGGGTVQPVYAGANTQPGGAERGAVTLQYLGDALGCTLNLQAQVGDRTVVPNANPYLVNDVALGPTQYQIGGAITCPTPSGPVSCIAAGSGSLVLRSGAAYNVVWQNVGPGQCQVGLTPAG